MKTRLRSIDCLRGAAAFYVVLYHIWNRYYPNQNTQGSPWRMPEHFSLGYWLTFPTIQFGYIGVTLFFVLSGFCIHLPQAKRFLATGADTIDYRSYARRRFWRLYPAYLASLLISALIVGCIPAAIAIAKHKAVDFAALFHVSDVFYNAFFLQFFSKESLDFNGVYWTLLFEAQFYLVYPLLLWSYRRLGMWVVCLGLLTLEVSTVSATFPLNKLFVSRWYEWYLGMWAAELYLSRAKVPYRIIAASGLALGIGSTFFPESWLYRDILLATGFFGLTLWAANAENRLNPAAEERFFRKLTALFGVGVISYSLYLIHVPLIDLVYQLSLVAEKASPRLEGMWRWSLPISLPLSLVTAKLFFRWFEAPYMHAAPAPTAAGPQRTAQDAIKPTCV